MGLSGRGDRSVWLGATRSLTLRPAQTLLQRRAGDVNTFHRNKHKCPRHSYGGLGETERRGERGERSSCSPASVPSLSLFLSDSPRRRRRWRQNDTDGLLSRGERLWGVVTWRLPAAHHHSPLFAARRGALAHIYPSLRIREQYSHGGWCVPRNCLLLFIY